MDAAKERKDYEPTYIKRKNQISNEEKLNNAWDQLDQSHWTISQFLEEMSDITEYVEGSSDELGK